MTSRRLSILALLPILLLCIACGGSGGEASEASGGSATSAPAPTVAAAPPTPAGETIRTGGTLVVAAGTDPGSLNPAINTSGAVHFAAGSLFNGLVDLDQDFAPKPDLAASWTVADDGKTYTFKLAPNVQWHDGRPFTSADVKFTFEEVLLKYHARTKSGLEGVLAGIETPDDGTVIFRFKEPYGPLLQRLNVIEAPILPRHIYQGSDPLQNPANLKPVGTGPFRFAEYKKGESVTLEKWASYFKPGLPRLDKLVFRIIPQSQTAVLAFEKGEVDYIGVPGADVATLQKRPNTIVARTPGGSGGSFCMQTIIPNHERAPLDQPAVRQALSQAIDRERMVKQVLFDQGRASRGPIASTLWAFDKSLGALEYNPTKAAAALDAAGQRPGAGGTRFKLTAVLPTAQARTGEILKENFAAVGVDLDVKAVEFNDANQTVFIKRDFDLGYASYCNGPDPEIGVRRAYVSSNIAPVLFSNGAAYRNAKVDELFDRAARAVSRDERAKLYGEAQRILVGDAAYFWLYEAESAYAVQGFVRDIRPWSSSLAEYTWLAK